MNIQPKPSVLLAETSVTNGASSTSRVDTLGYRELTLVVRQSTSNAVTNKLATCKLSEADVTSSTSATAITAFVGGGAGGFTIPAADTSNPQVYQFHLDLRGRKRYIFLEVSPVTTQTFTAVAMLTKGENVLATAADAGIGLLVEG